MIHLFVTYLGKEAKRIEANIQCVTQKPFVIIGNGQADHMIMFAKHAAKIISVRPQIKYRDIQQTKPNKPTKQTKGQANDAQTPQL